ncbi:MAG: carboxypeptidase-like regulatory domain-containing protein [Actinomycetota bacterium]
MKRSRWLLVGLVTIFIIGLLAAPSSAAKALSFVTQPSDAIRNQTITTLPLDALDGTVDGAAIQVLASSNTRVTLSSVPSGTSQTVRAGADGIARFPSFSIGTPGTYTLVATANGFDPTPASSSFRIFDAGEACSGGGTCDPSTGNLNANNETAKVAGTSNGGGVVGVALNIESAPVCAGDSDTEFNHGPGVLSAFWNNIGGQVTITLTISKAWDQIQPRNGASFYQVCFTYDQPGKPPFTDKFGNLVETGLLPDCGPSVGPPCIASRNKNNKGNVVIVVRSPVDAKCR